MYNIITHCVKSDNTELQDKKEEFHIQSRFY
mgnify:CR=1 FL=1|jgi:hypothetical protein